MFVILYKCLDWIIIRERGVEKEILWNRGETLWNRDTMWLIFFKAWLVYLTKDILGILHTILLIGQY